MKIQQSQAQIYRNQSPAFGYTRSSLGKAIDKFIKTKEPSEKYINEFLDKIDDFIEMGKDGKTLGAGFRGKVFKIDDKYVLKMDKNAHYYDIETPKIGSWLDSIGLKSFYGKPVLTFNRFCRVLKNVSSNGKHTPAGIPSEIEKNFITYGQKCEYWNNTYLPRFAELPQKSFDALAKDFATLNKQGRAFEYYSFDTKNPNNIVLVGKNSLRIVDDIDKVNHKTPNSTCGLLNLLVHRMDLDYNIPRDITNIDSRCQLIKKIFLAGEKYKLPIISTPTDSQTLQYVCEEFGNPHEIINSINRIRANAPNQKAHLEAVSKYLDETFTPDAIKGFYSYY